MTNLGLKHPNVIKNLRHRWPKELEPYSDEEIIAIYEVFYFSEDAGNNDEKFPEYFGLLPTFRANPVVW